MQRSINSKGLPLGCPDAEADLQALVDALVLPSETMRAGYEDVLLWVKDSKSFIAGWKHKRVQDIDASSLDFEFDGKICNSESELTEAILNKWEDGKRYLYRHRFRDFFSPRNPTLADKADNIVEKDATHNQDLGLAMFLFYMNTTKNPSCPVYWDGKKYEKPSDISTAIYKQEDESSIIKMLSDKFLSWKFSKTKEIFGDNFVDNILEIENITSSFPQLSYYILMYTLDSTKENNITVDEFFRNLSKENNPLLVNDKAFAYLYAVLGYKEDVLSTKNGLKNKHITGNNISDVELLYELFENICNDKTFVREHYMNYSLNAELYQTYKNLNMASFCCVDAKKKIGRLKLNAEISISDLRNNFALLVQYLKEEEQERIRLEKEKEIKQIEKEKNRLENRKKLKVIIFTTLGLILGAGVGGGVGFFIGIDNSIAIGCVIGVFFGGLIGSGNFINFFGSIIKFIGKYLIFGIIGCIIGVVAGLIVGALICAGGSAAAGAPTGAILGGIIGGILGLIFISGCSGFLIGGVIGAIVLAIIGAIIRAIAVSIGNDLFVYGAIAGAIIFGIIGLIIGFIFQSQTLD